jgi:hypothetical protein
MELLNTREDVRWGVQKLGIPKLLPKRTGLAQKCSQIHKNDR